MKNKLPWGAVKESFDNLPAGLCFATAYGMPILVNRVMHRLSHTLTGQALQNAETFWAALAQGNLPSGGERISGGNQPVIRMSDGSVRTFSRCVVTLERQTITQITAADTTDLHNLAAQLQTENQALVQLGERLRSYQENLGELTRQEELLNAKIRIHDSVGQALSRTRYAIAQTAPEEQAAPVLDAWEHITDLLRWEIAPKPQQSGLNYLQETATAVGVRLVLEGGFPPEQRAGELFVMAASEALTNAIRHAGAQTLTIQLEATPRLYTVRFTNDGTQPQGEITEGGGIVGVRTRLERFGGTVTVQTNPEFCLTVRIPRQEGTQ